MPDLKKFILVILLTSLSCLVINYVYAQSGVMLEGKIVADSNKAFSNVYVKINAAKTNLMLAFTNTGSTSHYNTTINITEPGDSIVITASHTGYTTIVKKIWVEPGKKYTVDFTLLTDLHNLGNVTVNAPPVWTRGDTTFYKVDAFKDGDERKLIDVITKMPGFEINQDGVLLFNKKAVEKIMIEGEEIFADKIKLILNNMPVHVLNTVQALENQTANKLLKGLEGGSKVFVNLGLSDKAKLKAAFGDGEIGVGTQKRYLFNPVLFTLYGKLKAGYIGKWNSMGEGIDWRIESEMLNNEYRYGERWLMQQSMLEIINNFSPERYITNNQFDNRLQINYPISKKVKSKTEISYLADKQVQQTTRQSTFLTDTGYNKRNDENHIAYQPKLFVINQKLIWDIDTARQLNFQLQYSHNGNSSMQTAFINQNNRLDTTLNEVKNKWGSFFMAVNYTHRKTAKTANEFTAEVLSNKYPQNGAGLSSAWPYVFNIGSPYYTMLNHQLNNNYEKAKLQWRQLQKLKSSTLTNSITIGWQKAVLDQNMFFTGNPVYTGGAVAAGFTGNGIYKKLSLMGSTNSIFKIKKIPISFTSNYGIDKSTIEENKVATSFSTLVYNLDLTNKQKYSKTLNGRFSISASQEQVEFVNLHSIVLPKNVTNFSNYSGIQKPVKNLSASYLIYYNWKKKLNLNDIIFTYRKNENAWLPKLGIRDFIFINSDSLTQSSTESFFVASNHNFNMIKQHLHISASMGLNISTSLFANDLEILRRKFILSYIHLLATKDWQKKYFLEFRYGISNSKIELPKKIGNQFAQSNTDIKTTLRQRYALSKTQNIVLNTEFYQRNLNTPNASRFLFADLEYNFTLPKKPLSFIIKAQNLTNQRFYYLVNTGTLYQSFYQIPIVKRNIFISMRYEL